METKDYHEIELNGNRPSEEQWSIINGLIEGCDCESDAVPGGGKSTTCYFIALIFQILFPLKRILNLTFSADLKKESRVKVQKYGIKNMDIESYNSFAHNYYGQGGHSSEDLYEIIEKNKPAIKNTEYDLIILDEVQDMQSIFFKLIHKYIRDINFRPQLFVIGDKFQGIFEFKGADIRYLTKCREIFQRSFICCPLTLSRRLTNPMGRFMNDIILNEKRIITDKEGPKVRYLIFNPYGDTFLSSMCNTITKLLKSYKPDDIFILAPSLKSGTPITMLANKLTSEGIKIFWGSNDSDKELKEEHTRGKVVFTSFHKSKGRERKINIVYGCDESYYHFGNKDLSKEKCPEPIFVALTRGLEQLFMIHGHNAKNDSKKYRKLPFIRKSIKELKDLPYCKVVKENDIQWSDLEYGNNTEIINNSENKFPVTDFIKYLTDRHEKELYPYSSLLYDRIKSPNNGIRIETDISVDGLVENVADLNGISIPSYWEFLKKGDMTIYRLISNHFHSENIRKVYNRLVYPPNNIKDVLHIANIYSSCVSGVEYNLNQIDVYGNNWLPDHKLEMCLANLDETIKDKNIKFEKSIVYTFEHEKYGKIELSGSIDAVDTDNVWEFKCTGSLTMSHKLQLGMYGWLWKKLYPEDKKSFKLFNIYTCEIQELDVSHYALDDVVEVLIENKLQKQDKKDDDEFIRMCLSDIIEMPIIENNFKESEYLLDDSEEE